jgi:hypothetical protein
MSLIVENFSVLKRATSAQSAVIRTVLYFDMFDHPLKEKEIYGLLRNNKTSGQEVSSALRELCKEGMLQHQDGFFFLPGKNETIKRRLNGEEHATRSLQTAKKYSRIISKFPFVRGISLSGSISKKFMDNNSDIDYFIITAPGRMWLARTLLILYKKIFLLNSRKNFCVNYFLSEDNLEVPDKNIFTATEVSFLIPTYNYDLYLRFRKANAWSSEFLPNFPLRGRENLVSDRKYRLKKIFEKLFSGSLGSWLDTYFFRITLKFWKRKFSHFDESTFDFRLRSRKNVSKHHPLGYQEKILGKYADRIAAFTRTNNILLHGEIPVHS